MEKKSHKPSVKSSVVAAVAATAALADGSLTTSKPVSSSSSPTHAGDAVPATQHHHHHHHHHMPHQQQQQHHSKQRSSSSLYQFIHTSSKCQQPPISPNAIVPSPSIPVTSKHPTNNNNNNTNHNKNDTALVHTKTSQAGAMTNAAAAAAAIEQFTAAVNAKATSARNKSEEAINDLRQRIPEIDNIFDVHSRIGNGTFSTVLLGTLKKERDLPDHMRRKFAIKHHIPTSHPDRIMKELQCMAKIGGTDNVVGINCCIRYNESVAFIMPYMPHDRFHDFFNKMEISEVQYYMKNLLIALRHVHKFNVIHRDVKPSNFLYNRRKRQFLLVDFGLAQQVPTPQVAVFNAGSVCAANNSSNVPQLPLPASVEGKRSRELDDTGGASAMTAGQKPSEAPTTSTDVSGVAKRLRCTGPQGDQQLPAAASNVSNARVTNSCGIMSGGSPFKMPLKQLNEITGYGKGAGGATCGVSVGANVANNNGIYEAPTALNRQVKSAVLGVTIGNRLQSKLRQQQLQGAAASAVNSNMAVVTQPGVSSTQMAIGTSNITVAAVSGVLDTAASSVSTAKYNTNRNLAVNNNTSKCFCYGNPQVCNICLIKKEIHASRAGTPGYRPPEVLLKYPDQTTAVDVWAVGVIFLSIMSSVYPFFKAPNDYVALAEMVTIFGDKTIRKTAFVLDRLVTLSQKTKPLDLRKLCVRFRNRSKFSSPELLRKYQRQDGTCEVCKNCDQFYFNCLCTESHYKTEPLDADDPFPASAYDLLYKLLEVNPHKRITAEEALKHPFFNETGSSAPPPALNTVAELLQRKRRE